MAVITEASSLQAKGHSICAPPLSSHTNLAAFSIISVGNVSGKVS